MRPNGQVGAEQPRTAGRGVLKWTVDRPWTLLICWTVLWTLPHAFKAGWSWHYQITGTRGLFSQEGLHLYAQHPEVQTGPLTFVVGAPFVLPWSEQAGFTAGVAFMLLVGLLTIREIRNLQISGKVLDDRTWLFSSLAIMAAWTELALHWGHLDDAIFAIPISPASTLSLLGLAGQETSPWCRYAQLIGGFALSAVAVRRGRISAVLLIAVAVRLLLDPETKNYYDAGLMRAAGIFDVGVTSALVPYAILAVAALIYAPPYLLTSAPTLHAVRRTGTLLTLTAAAPLVPQNSRRPDPLLKPLEE